MYIYIYIYQYILTYIYSNVYHKISLKFFKIYRLFIFNYYSSILWNPSKSLPTSDWIPHQRCDYHLLPGILGQR